MRSTLDTAGKRPRRHRRHGPGWHRWLLYPLIAVSAYLLVALAKTTPYAVPYAAAYAATTGVPAPAR